MKHYDFIEIGCSDFDTLIQEATPDQCGISVEPLSCYLNNLPNPPSVLKVQSAISNVDGETEIWYIDPEVIKVNNLPQYLSGCNSINKPHYQASQNGFGKYYTKEKVPVISVETFLRLYKVQGVSYLKIDTEGHDTVIIHAWLGAIEKRLTTRPRKIMFESNILSNPDDINWLVTRLTTFGYNITKLENDTVATLPGADIVGDDDRYNVMDLINYDDEIYEGDFNHVTDNDNNDITIVTYIDPSYFEKDDISTTKLSVLDISSPMVIYTKPGWKHAIDIIRKKTDLTGARTEIIERATEDSFYYLQYFDDLEQILKDAGDHSDDTNTKNDDDVKNNAESIILDWNKINLVGIAAKKNRFRTSEFAWVSSSISSLKSSTSTHSNSNANSKISILKDTLQYCSKYLIKNEEEFVNSFSKQMKYDDEYVILGSLDAWKDTIPKIEQIILEATKHCGFKNTYIPSMEVLLSLTQYKYPESFDIWFGDIENIDKEWWIVANKFLYTNIISMAIDAFTYKIQDKDSSQQDKFHAWYQLGNCFFKSGQIEKCTDAFSKASSIDNRRIEPLYQLCTINRCLGNYDKALDYLKKCLSIPIYSNSSSSSSSVSTTTTFYNDIFISDPNIQKWHLHYEASLISYYTYGPEVCGKICDAIVLDNKNDFPIWIKECCHSNQRFNVVSLDKFKDVHTERAFMSHILDSNSNYFDIISQIKQQNRQDHNFSAFLTSCNPDPVSFQRITNSNTGKKEKGYLTIVKESISLDSSNITKQKQNLYRFVFTSDGDGVDCGADGGHNIYVKQISGLFKFVGQQIKDDICNISLLCNDTNILIEYDIVSFEKQGAKERWATSMPISVVMDLLHDVPSVNYSKFGQENNDSNIVDILLK